MKAISETISTVIISSVIIMVSITIFYMAISSLTTTMQASEYGYMKSSLINIASNIHEIIKGTSMSISIPQGRIGVGYRIHNNIVYEVDILTATGWYNITIDNESSALEVTSFNVISTTSKLVFGINNLTVNDIAFIPSIWEYYKDGATILNFNTSRFYVNTYVVTNGVTSEMYIRIYYLQLRPKYMSGPRTIMFIPGGRIIEKQVNGVEDLIIREIDVSTGKTIRYYRPTNVFNTGYSITALVVVDQLYVVMTYCLHQL